MTDGVYMTGGLGVYVMCGVMWCLLKFTW